MHRKGKEDPEEEEGKFMRRWKIYLPVAILPEELGGYLPGKSNKNPKRCYTNGTDVVSTQLLS